MSFQPGQRMGFNCSRRDRHTRASLENLTVALDADPVLWRNVCSATLDRDLYPNLASTPYWLKALFAFLALLPRWRELFLSGILWVQIQAMFYAHDFHLYHGHVPLARPWTAQPIGGRAPMWAYRAQAWSMRAISRVVMAACYWGGWLFCGIRGAYEVYTPQPRDGQGEKSGPEG